MIKKVVSICSTMFSIFNKKQRVLFGLVLICTLIAASLEMLGVSVIIPLVNIMLQPNEFRDSRIGSLICNIFNLSSNTQITYFVVFGVVFVYFFKNLYFCFFSWIKSKFACKIKRELSLEMFKSYMKRGYSFFLTKNFSELNQEIGDDIRGVYLVMNGFFTLLTQIMVILAISIFMMISDWFFALSIIISSSVCLAAIWMFFRKRIQTAGSQVRHFQILASRYFRECVYGVKDVFVMRKHKYYLDKYESNVIKQQRSEVELAIGNEVPAYVIEAICVVGIMAMLALRLGSTDDKAGFLAVLASFAVGAFRILPAMGKVSISTNMILSYQAGLMAVNKNIMDARNEDLVMFDIETKEDIDDSFAGFSSVLEIKDIDFRYNESADLILNDLSIKINKGESVAFVGESGAGKSTLADIILGLLKPSKGRVLLDGKDINSIPVSYSNIVGYVPQAIYLSDTSIRENVAFGFSEEDIDDDLVLKCLERANISDFISQLPKGINTEVGDRGIRLSGGQKQRIGIARALYHNPDILILDEATSALDNETEKSVMDAIEILQGSVTLIIIAHRISTIRKCDRIYLINNGKATETTYDELK